MRGARMESFQWIVILTLAFCVIRLARRARHNDEAIYFYRLDFLKALRVYRRWKFRKLRDKRDSRL